MAEPSRTQAVEQRQPFDLPFAAIGPALEIYFPTSTDVRDIAHGLGEVPDGVLKYLETGGYVLSVTPHLWTKDIAYLQSSAASTRARVAFFTLREPIRDA